VAFAANDLHLANPQKFEEVDMRWISSGELNEYGPSLVLNLVSNDEAFGRLLTGIAYVGEQVMAFT
jgi:hypothetical protein